MIQYLFLFALGCLQGLVLWLAADLSPFGWQFYVASIPFWIATCAWVIEKEDRTSKREHND